MTISKLGMLKLYLFSFAGFLVSSVLMNAYAGSISEANVWLNRYQDDSYNSYFGFYSDIWGTVSEFQSITLSSPLGNHYDLSLASEGDQWSFDVEGNEADIISEFIDGLYRFDVVYTDNTTDSIDIRLGSVLPEFPTSLSLTGNVVSWDRWLDPKFPSHIEVVINETGQQDSVDAVLSYSDTSFRLPDNFVKDNAQYDLELWFVSGEHPGGFKSSVQTVTINAATVPEPGGLTLFLGGLAAFILIRRRLF